MASKQAKAKEVQGYEQKPNPKTCINCRHYEFDMEIPLWQRMANDKQPGRYDFALNAFPHNLRCALGGFAVKKMATCKEFERKASE